MNNTNQINVALTTELDDQPPHPQILVNNPQDIFVLLSDGDGTMHSKDTPFGVAVTTEEEAKRFVAKGSFGYTHSYEKLRVFDTFEEGIKFWKGK